MDMNPKEKIAAFLLGLVILGAVGYLLFFAPLGWLGSVDGTEFSEVDRFSILGFIAFYSIGGYLFIRWQGKGK